MRQHRSGDGHPEAVLLHALVDGETSPDESLRLARHLRDCRRCTLARDRIARLASQLEALPCAEETEGFSAAVMGLIADLPAPRRRPRRLRLVAPLVTLLAGVAAALSTPLPERVLKGLGRLFQVHWRPDLIETAVGVFAAILARLGRAVAGILPGASSVPAPGPLHSPVPVLLFLLLSALVLVATSVVALAFAGRGLLRTPPRNG